jgi:DNA replication and repair protein RecF
MFLQHLSLYQFKNHELTSLDFTEKTVCILGNNGVGKTNILDAIYYLSIGKSFFNAQDNFNIQHGKTEFSLKGIYQIDNEKETILCTAGTQRKKIIKRNDKAYKRIADHIGLIPIVFISPTDILLLIEGSETRRKFLDAFIAQINTNYVQLLLNYQRTLLQRNTLLKQFAENNFFDVDTLSVYDDKLILLNEKIYQIRKDFINDFIPYFKEYYQKLSKKNEIIDLTYESQLNDNSISELFAQNKRKDLTVTHTTSGIHKDDLLFLKDDILIKKSGSQGQQKTYLLALKLAQTDYLKKHAKQTPILLLDDIFDKLDENRLGNLMQLLHDENLGQIFITDTHLQRIPEKLNALQIQHQVIDLEKEMHHE